MYWSSLRAYHHCRHAILYFHKSVGCVFSGSTFDLLFLINYSFSLSIIIIIVLFLSRLLFSCFSSSSLHTHANFFQFASVFLDQEMLSRCLTSLNMIFWGKGKRDLIYVFCGEICFTSFA